jgi:membrane peptidoglycan carboxypeptidase
MNAITRRKTLHSARRPASRGGVPLWLTLLLSAGVFAAALGALGLGAVFALYTNYTADYEPIQGMIAKRYVGLTEVYDRGGPDNGVFLGNLSNPNAPLLNPVTLDQVSPWLIDATISTEDNNFYSNAGVDPRGLLRAAWDNYVGGGIGTGSGGSTLTQQLVKIVYLSDDCTTAPDGTQSCIAPRTLQRKVKEIAYAIEVDRNYSKQDVLTWYLNQISYADRYVGIEAASEGYFRKPASDLDLAEAALLAGVPQSPTAYHPRLNCVRGKDGNCVLDDQGRSTVNGAAKARQEAVLNLMVTHKRITQDQADAAMAEPLLIYPAQNSVKASAWIDDQVEPRLVRMCEAGMLPRTPGTTNCTDSVHSGGYRVTTTLDYAETQKAEEMMRKFISTGLDANCACHNAAIATIDPTSGQIIVYAPNVDPTYTSDPKVAGNIDQLVEINQPGSSLKPAVYTSYFDKLNKTPMSSLWDTSPMKISDPNATEVNQVTIVNPRPGGGGEGLITARAAMGGSQNVAAFRIAEEVGIDNVIAEAKALGITTLQQGFDPTFNSHSDIYYGPSIAVGGANVRAIDMAYMNATISNMGLMIGVPTLATTLDPKTVLSLSTAKGDDYQKALAERLDFVHGNTRLPGTRQLDPVSVLQVQGIDGSILYQEGPDLQKQQVDNAANVWQTHSIMSDCNARFIIWTCGSSNNDNDLDAFMPDGTKFPMGIMTGTQQGPLNANDTLATWMNGYTRYAATAVWVGNADKSLVHDGAAYGYASADTTIHLFKNWMSQYHADLQAAGVFTGEPANFDSVQPSNVAYQNFQSATTERCSPGGRPCGSTAGCSQIVKAWVRTDVENKGDCQGKGFMPLPAFQVPEAITLSHRLGIPTGPGGAFAPEPATTAPPTQATPSAPLVPTRTTTPVATPPPAATHPPATQPPATPPPAATKPPATHPPATSVPTAPPPAATKPPPDNQRRGR